MKRVVQLSFSFLAILSPLAASTAHGCQCREPQPVCAEYREADVVFTGQVLTIEPVADQVSSKIVFRIERALKGANGNRVELIKWGTSCDYSFREGASYLIYAFQNEKNGTLSTWLCSRTRELAAAKNDLEYIDAPDARVTAITGILADGDKRLRNVKVTARLGNRVSRASTNNEGWFRLRVPPGKYMVQIYLPIDAGVGGTSDLMERISSYRGTKQHWIVGYSVKATAGECSFIDVPLFIPRDGTNVRILR